MEALVQGQEDIVVIPEIFAASAIQKGMPIKIIVLYHPKTPVVLISHPDKPHSQAEGRRGQNRGSRGRRDRHILSRNVLHGNQHQQGSDGRAIARCSVPAKP